MNPRDQVLKDAVSRIAEVVEQLTTPVNQRDLLLIEAGIALGVDVAFAHAEELQRQLKIALATLWEKAAS